MKKWILIGAPITTALMVLFLPWTWTSLRGRTGFYGYRFIGASKLMEGRSALPPGCYEIDWVTLGDETSFPSRYPQSRLGNPALRK